MFYFQNSPSLIYYNKDSDLEVTKHFRHTKVYFISIKNSCFGWRTFLRFTSQSFFSSR